jgi:hypothetical protein
MREHIILGGPMDMNEEIAKVAYELYERDGKQNGKDREHWLEAERIVKARRTERGKAESSREKASPAVVAAPKKAPVATKEKQVAPKLAAAAAKDKDKKTTRTPRSK